jgi:hypothetical protein
LRIDGIRQASDLTVSPDGLVPLLVEKASPAVRAFPAQPGPEKEDIRA